MDTVVQYWKGSTGGTVGMLYEDAWNIWRGYWKGLWGDLNVI